MANASIKTAFERMWQHVTAALGSKAEAEHIHNNVVYTDDVATEAAVAPIDADTLGGKLPEEFVLASEIPVVSVNGKTGEITLAAGDVGARPDTWTPTIAEIGAAPAGYGLGVSVIENISDANNARTSGWYYLDIGAANSPSPQEYVYIRVDNFDTSSLTQTAYSVNTNGAVIKRSRVFGTWGEWEWVNPPMVTGVEYRTTERIAGKVVYKKNVDGVIQYRLDGETAYHNYSDAVGAVPAGYIQWRTSCTTNDEINAVIQNAYDSISDGQLIQIQLGSQTEGLGLPGGDWHVMIYRSDASYGFAEAKSYSNAGTMRIFRREKYANAWSAWRDETSYQYATAVHSHSDATTSAAGFMSAADKTKLNKTPNFYYSSTQPSGWVSGDIWLKPL